MSVTTDGQFYYRVCFTDKKVSPWLLSRPEAFLSARALERRARQNISIDSLDLPVNPHYIETVLNDEAKLIHASKWMNCIVVSSTDVSLPERLWQLPFVREIKLVKGTGGELMLQGKVSDALRPDSGNDDPPTDDGSSGQISQLNAQHLHRNGFHGEGVQIAVLDAGFMGADIYGSFDSLRIEGRIAGTHDFVDGGTDVYNDHNHGMSVLSVMAANMPGKLKGIAPRATYWLLRTEDVHSEFLIEEDNWVVAAEFADSAGADIINTSLGYSTFDDPAMNHTYAHLDGNSTYITRGANIAASKGILVVSSAGNEGSAGNPWKYLTAPSDGTHVIAVGAVDVTGNRAPFSSYGPAYGGAIKPNVVATGWNTILQRGDGTIGPGNGTSYSSPLIAGAAACLWQANPEATAAEVKRAIEQSAHLYLSPDSALGYGIPNMELADRLLKLLKADKNLVNSAWDVYPNPVADYLILERKKQTAAGNLSISIYTTDGRLVYKVQHPGAAKILLPDLHHLPPGLLILYLQSEHGTDVMKIIKSR